MNRANGSNSVGQVSDSARRESFPVLPRSEECRVRRTFLRVRCLVDRVDTWAERASHLHLCLLLFGGGGGERVLFVAELWRIWFLPAHFLRFQRFDRPLGFPAGSCHCIPYLLQERRSIASLRSTQRRTTGTGSFFRFLRISYGSTSNVSM